MLLLRCMVAIWIFALNPAVSVDLTHRQMLTNSEDAGSHNMELCWGFNDSHIEVQLTYPTLGWLAMGLSPNGGMDQSDILFGYVNDTTNEVIIQVCKSLN